MNIWRWLTTPDPNAGYTTTKLLKLAIRVVLFAILATLVSSLLQMTPLAPYLKTWWGSMLLVLALYLPLMKFMAVDTFVPRSRTPAPPTSKTGKQTLSAAQRRKEKNRFAGVRKSPPKYGGRR